MATHSEIDVSALRILDGERLQSEPDDLGNIGICDVGRDKGSLYILVNAQGARRVDMEGALVETIADAYRSSPGGVTGALLTAIKEANVVLFNDNQRSFGSQRTKAGVYCAVVRPDHKVVLAYAGPAVAVVVGPSGVEHLYSDLEPVSPRSADRSPSPSNELGANPDIEVSFYTCDFNSGDMIMLASPSLLETGIDDTELANALEEAGVDGLPGDRDLTALLLTNVAATAEPARSGAAAVAEAEADAEPVAGRGGGIMSAGAAAVQSLVGRFRSEPRVTQATDAAPAREAVAPRGQEAMLPEWLDKKDATPRDSADAQPRQIKMPALRMPSLPVSRMQFSVLAAIVLLIVAAFWWQARTQAQAREQKFQALMSQSEQKRTLGQASLDRTVALAYLKDADALVGDALAVKPAAASALALRESIQRDTDVAKGIVRMPSTQVTTLYSFSAAGTMPARVVGDGFNLYVLDKGDQKVYKFVLNAQGNGIQPGGDSVLLRKGDQVGGIVVGDLLDIAWIPAGGARTTANLCIMESGGNLIQYDVTKGLKALSVRDARTWRKAQSTGGYGGNFYVLDNLANTILRYRPDANGYTSPATAYLQTQVDLASAVDMAIDGDVFVLMVNGQIVWLTSGKPQPFTTQGLDRPLSAPVAIFTNDGSQSLYVADPANSRVVQLSKQGVMQKQFSYDDQESSFQRLRGVFADEKKLSLYVTAGTKLMFIAIPK